MTDWNETYLAAEALRHDIERHIQITTDQQQEIERLRAALDRITQYSDDSTAPMVFSANAYQYGVNDMAKIARAALSVCERPDD